MKQLRLSVATLLVAALAGGHAHAQARGPSAEEILENGQHIATRREEWEQALQQAREQEEKEREELRDPAVRARKLAELDTWFRRLPGRFRIDGRIQQAGAVTVQVLASTGESRMVDEVVQTTLGGKVTGVADCIGVGEGIGLQCIINATWPDIDLDVAKVGSVPTPSEMLKTFNPAMLVLGLNLDPPGIRAMMVNADSLAHTWMGKLSENTARANRLNRCLFIRCIQPLEIIAAPESDVVTIVLRSSGVTLRLIMYRDPEAEAEKPMEVLKAR